MTTESAPDGWTMDTSGGTVTVEEVPSSSDKSRNSFISFFYFNSSIL
jgi:hypothetical protein